MSSTVTPMYLHLRLLHLCITITGKTKANFNDQNLSLPSNLNFIPTLSIGFWCLKIILSLTFKVPKSNYFILDRRKKNIQTCVHFVYKSSKHTCSSESVDYLVLRPRVLRISELNGSQYIIIVAWWMKLVQEPRQNVLRGLRTMDLHDLPDEGINWL